MGKLTKRGPCFPFPLAHLVHTNAAVKAEAQPRTFPRCLSNHTCGCVEERGGPRTTVERAETERCEGADIRALTMDTVAIPGFFADNLRRDFTPEAPP